MTRRELPSLYIKKLSPNKSVRYQGYLRVIEYVNLSQGRLLVKLVDVGPLVAEEDIECELTLIDFNEPYVLGLRDHPFSDKKTKIYPTDLFDEL